MSCISIFNETTVITSGHDNKIKVLHCIPKLESPLYNNNNSTIEDSNDINNNNNGIIDDSEEYYISYDNITLLPTDTVITTTTTDSDGENNINDDNNTNYRKGLYNCNLVSIYEITIPDSVISTVTPQEICKNYCKLKYPNICEIFGYTTDNDIYYLVYNGEISTLNNFIYYCQNNVIQWKYCECVHSILCLLNSYDYISNHSNYLDRIFYTIFINRYFAFIFYIYYIQFCY